MTSLLSVSLFTSHVNPPHKCWTCLFVLCSSLRSMVTSQSAHTISVLLIISTVEVVRMRQPGNRLKIAGALEAAQYMSDLPNLNHVRFPFLWSVLIKLIIKTERLRHLILIWCSSAYHIKYFSVKWCKFDSSDHSPQINFSILGFCWSVWSKKCSRPTGQCSSLLHNGTVLCRWSSPAGNLV